MIARRHIASGFLPAALAAALHAAQIATPAGAEANTATPAAAAAASAKKSAETAAIAKPPANTANTEKPSAATPSGAPAIKLAPTPPAPDQPGIISAVKTKGPPPVPKGPVPPPPLSPRFRQTRERIAALFDPRNAAPAPPDPRTNPFRPIGAVASVPGSTTENAPSAPVAPIADLATLQQAVATLRVKGTVQLGRTLQLVITSAPGKEGTYKEGDIINVVLPPGDPVHLRVRQVSRNSVTLTLNDAEMTLKF